MDAEAQLLIGKPVIFIPNEWEEMVVGIVEEIDTSKYSPIVTVFDYISNEHRTFIGFPFAYNTQRLHAFLKLDPYERFSIVYGRNFPDVQRKPKLKEHISHELTMLRKHGFFKKLRDEMGYSGPDYIMTFGLNGAFD